MNLQTITTEILMGCRKRDQKIISWLYKQLYGLMMGVATRYEKNREDALHCVNQTFLKILEHLDEHEINGNLEVWVRKITVHTAIDQFRKKKKEKEHFIMEEQEVMENYSLESGEMELFTIEILEEMLKELPELSSRVFNLYAIDGYSHKEIAELLGMTESTSRWHVSEARKKLKVLVVKYLDEKKIMAG